MKRQQFWLWLLLLPPMLLSCIEKKYPQVTTIINGIIVDENDKPIEGIEVDFSGKKPLGLSATNTFSLTTKSDKNGMFTFSQIVPNGTTGFDLFITHSTNQYRNFILIDNAYKNFNSDAILAYITIGKTNNLKFQIKKI